MLWDQTSRRYDKFRINKCILREREREQEVKKGLEVRIRYDTKHILMHKILRPEKEQNNYKNTHINYQKNAKRRKKTCYPIIQKLVCNKIHIEIC